MSDRVEPEQEKASLSRRAVLKKGAVIGGTALWVTPVVQTIGMTSALAQTTSGASGPNGPNNTPTGGTTTAGGSTGGDDALAATGTAFSKLATTGGNAQTTAEVGLAATALGVAFVAVNRIKDRDGDEQEDEPQSES